MVVRAEDVNNSGHERRQFRFWGINDDEVGVGGFFRFFTQFYRRRRMCRFIQVGVQIRNGPLQIRTLQVGHLLRICTLLVRTVAILHIAGQRGVCRFAHCSAVRLGLIPA
ncbi:hypothetical protein BST42_27025 [Mycolicibacterium rhodesiae]|uniref:Uncharacterized protein n=1 Tax=Mycolicibacterium rhodesiae TaxID=36814 RepID=A0A1X0IJ21_MYCRH|nr:hypothetical protein BST42_27025 [Mycolicibacterium rhodesiae]